MRLILIGASGDIGKAAFNELDARHEIIKVGRSGGDYQLDMSDMSAVKSMYKAVGSFDAVVSCAGDATLAPLAEMDQKAFMLGLQQKVMGQVNLVLAGLNVVADGGRSP